MDIENLDVLILHQHPEYLKACCDLINEEWPRSETARMMSLLASCDDLPTSLILINEKKLILGHCKLTPIPSIPQSCFIETVVISKNLRGRKLGTYLMKKVEEYCKNNLKLTMLHLSTKGQEKFYAKLGYQVCPPISIYGSLAPNKTRLKPPKPKDENCVPLMPVSNVVPPPPPPMPVFENVINNNTIISTKTYMFKYINEVI